MGQQAVDALFADLSYHNDFTADFTTEEDMFIFLSTAVCFFLLFNGKAGKDKKEGFPFENGKAIIASGVLIPADPPCANFQFATMEGRELTCGDFHARAAFPPPQVYSRRSSCTLSPPPLPLRARLPSPNRSSLGGCEPCGGCFVSPFAPFPS